MRLQAIDVLDGERFAVPVDGRFIDLQVEATPESIDDSSPREQAIADHALGVAARAIDEVVEYLRAAEVTLMEAVDATRLLAMRRDVEEQPDVISLRQTATPLLFASGFTVHGGDPDEESEGAKR